MASRSSRAPQQATQEAHQGPQPSTGAVSGLGGQVGGYLLPGDVRGEEGQLPLLLVRLWVLWRAVGAVVGRCGLLAATAVRGLGCWWREGLTLGLWLWLCWGRAGSSAC